MPKYKALEQPNLQPPAPRAVASDDRTLRQFARGSQRQGKQITEVGELRSRGFVQGQQGWRLTENDLEITGTITGGTIQTSASGQRVVIEDDEIKVYDSSGTLTGTFSGSSIGGVASALEVAGGNFTFISFLDDVNSGFDIGNTIDAAIMVNTTNLQISTDRADGNGGNIELIADQTGGTIKVYNPITLNSNKAYDIGEALTAFDDVYADDFQNVADFFFLDDRDDLAELSKIRGSGKYDERTGLELIDDDTVPEWLLSKDKKTGEVLRSSDGKPYISLRTLISLLMGSIRQLNSKING